jgi:hypothetical protein
MKRRIFFAIILVAAAFVAGRQVNRWKGADSVGAGGETRQSYRLDPGARVEVRGINGSVEINTAETDTADVRVTYAGGSPEDGPRVVVEHNPSGLVVRGEGRGGGFWRWLWGGREVRVAVVMTVPRRSEVGARGVNGPLEVGEVEGPVTVSGVNGRVEVTQAAGHTEVSGVNGNVKFGVARLGAEGIEVKGVNGNVEVFLRSSVDADLEVKGHNGQVILNVPNVTMQEREGHSRMRARFGAGGSPITFRGVNGNVRFESGAAAVSTSSLPPPPPPPPAPAAPQH